MELTILETAIMFAMLATGVEMKEDPGACAFEYDRLIPNLIHAYQEDERVAMEKILMRVDGMACEEMVKWATIMNSLD